MIEDILHQTLEPLLNRVRDAQFVPVAPLSITCWRTREPVTFAERESGTKAEVAVGEPWADELFDCAWMRFSAEVPVDVDLTARIDINGEACVVDDDGVPVRGLTSIKSTFDHRLGGPGKTLYRVPSGAVKDGKLVLWADAAFNDLFGFVKNGGVVALAELCTVREELRQLYYDLETLVDFAVALPVDDPRRVDLVEDLKVHAAELDCGDESSVAAARAGLEHWFACEDNPELLVHAIGHGHLDLAWLWPIRETIRKGERTLASVIYNLERYPHYHFGCSQPQLFQWIKDGQPGLFSRIKDAVRTGGIELQGTFWVEPDCSMPSGEAFVRQILYGSRFFRDEFGIVPTYCWQPDVFGYHGQLPQILAKSGHKYFMTQKLSWNVVNRFPHQSFHWEGIDGSRILAHMLPEETYNGPAAARSLLKIADDYVERDVSNHALLVYGIGDGGGGPDAEHLERLTRAPKLPGLPEVRFGTVTEFFDAWSADADHFKTWKGELYLERHQGTLTTQALVKRNNRRAEIALRELEWAAYLAGTRAGLPYPAEVLDRCWKEVLLYQFHDILPGSSIKRVYHECNARYAEILAELEELTARCYASVADGACAFNSLSWTRREWVKHDGGWKWVEVPPFGSIQLAGAVFFAGERELSAATDALENEFLRVGFDNGGHIVSIHDKNSGREVLAPGGVGNDLVVIEDTGDAWDFETDHPNKDVWPYLRRDVERPVLREQAAVIDGPMAELHQIWEFRASTIRQVVRLAAGSRQIGFDTEVDWQETGMMLRVRFPVSVQTDGARFEIPFGHIRRSTLEETSEERAQIEVAALQWLDLSEPGHGVALYNDCKYGFRMKGNVIDMALIRSVPHPGSPLIGKDDVAEGGTNRANFTDPGEHHFSYALRPHAGEMDAAELTAEARAFNTLLRVGAGIAAGLVETDLVLDLPAVEVVAVKPAEDGQGWIWRLVNVTDADVSISLDAAGGTWSECDLMEAPVASSPLGDGKFALCFGKFEIKTLRRL